MGYPNFGKVKTVVLPLTDEALTINEYKEKYGIDLKQFIVLDDGGFITLDNNFLDSTLILIRQSKSSGATTPLVPCQKVVTEAAYIADNQQATTLLASCYNEAEEGFYGLALFIEPSAEFSVDNIRINTREF